MKQLFFLTFLLLGFTNFISAQSATSAMNNHAEWQALLQKYVTKEGQVNYTGLKSDKTKLANYLTALSKNVPKAAASKEEKMSFWINTYNATTVKLIVDNYPIKSIKDINGGKPWDLKLFKTGAETYSLNEIENNILRPMSDARVHFALNCAAKSCPSLLNEAFTTGNVNNLLESRTKQFINDNFSNIITTDKIKISHLFDWYQKDFGDVRAFIGKYARAGKKINPDAAISYFEYNWMLNDLSI